MSRNELFAMQRSMAKNIAVLRQKEAKRHQAHMLLQSLKGMLGKDVKK